ncbi:uncharacterized protein LOC123443991 [Hordeum vulgare subsp. vulgare]|uniref:Uncharacterized protein n=1 Tax=Hordeum vulgare subsp. vulgare TaxID=112509 RepID=A0A8I6XEN9_HORVV|nr:uncharacterized protein LOC123443991 [Hordeum vulgare subsp. vulgare]XP_044976514.1 uncharacterized protein LOC123443991 [Hordeum vulgare subsp. vulgare]XP_044976515.1 uncharacterized protein LOC123443991 [Hordeum vulgare subsp. vulgare]XP_044976516.1 uncharacterized protein LOC123443991 [Hordeum vulgare subsp. vulgare]
MGSNRLPFGFISGGYSCSEQYEWQQLTLRQREQATREQPHSSANLSYPLHTPNRTERTSPSFDCVCDYAKGADGHIHATVTLGKVCQFNRGSSTQNGPYQADQYLPSYFPVDHFSEIDEARHRAYMDSFYTDKNPDHISASRLRHRDELRKADTKKPFEKLHTIKSSKTMRAIHRKQLKLSLHEDRNCRNAYHGKRLKTKKARWSSRKNHSSMSCVSKHERSSRQGRYGEHPFEQEAENSSHKRYGGQLAGEKAKKRMLYEGHPKGLCSLHEQEEHLHHEIHCSGSDTIRNDNWEKNAEANDEVDHNGAEGNCHLMKNIQTASATCCGPTKSNENSDVLRPKYSSKTIASSNEPNGSSSMKLVSDKQPSVAGCTKRPRNTRTEDVSTPNLQNLPVTHMEKGCTRKPGNTRSGEVSTCNVHRLPVTHMEKGVHTKQADNTSHSELLRECLDIWRRRKLRKESSAEAKKLDQTGSARHERSASPRSSESDDESVNASESASGSSESAAENDTALENSQKCRGPTSLGVQKRGEGRAMTNAEQPFRCLSGSNCNKSSAKQELKCNLEVLQEAHPGEIMQQKEENRLPCCLPTVHPTAMIQTSQNSCSDTSKKQTRRNNWADISKVDQAATSRPDSSVCWNVSQHEAISNHLDDGRKYKLGIGCEIKRKAAQGDGAKRFEQMATLITGPTLLDQKSPAVCSPDDGSVKVCGSECSNQYSESTLKLDKGKKPVKCSSGTDCEVIRLCSSGSDCSDIQQDTINCRIKRQVSSSLADSENDEGTKEDYQPAEVLEVTSNRQISYRSDVGRKISDVSRPTDCTPRFTIPDLNCLPSIITDEEEFEVSQEVINQATGHGLERHDACPSFSAFSGPAVQEELVNQPEKNEFIGGICARTGANGSQISDSHGAKGVVNQATGQDTSPSFSAFSGPAVQEEQFKQPEKNEFIGGICARTVANGSRISDSHSAKEAVNQATGEDTSQCFSAFSGTAVQEKQVKQSEKHEFSGGIYESEIANGSRICDSHSGPPNLNTDEESIASTQAFKCALGEFIKNILRPLWEEGLLSREVHKIIVKKAVDKVAFTLGPKVPRTEADTFRFFAEETQSVEQLVQGYLDVYLGKQVLKRTMPGGI